MNERIFKYRCNDIVGFFHLFSSSYKVHIETHDNMDLQTFEVEDNLHMVDTGVVFVNKL